MKSIFSPGGSQGYLFGQNILVSGAGRWFGTDRVQLVTIGVELQVGAGTITGALVPQFTAATLAGATVDTPPALSPVLLPAGSLHSTLSGVTLPGIPDRVAVAAATSGSFTLSFATPPAGKLRFGWVFGSGTGAAPNFLNVYVNVQEY